MVAYPNTYAVFTLIVHPFNSFVSQHKIIVGCASDRDFDKKPARKGAEIRDEIDNLSRQRSWLIMHACAQLIFRARVAVFIRDSICIVTN